MDLYKILGIPSTATDEEVKRAYRQLAKKYHPDMNMGASNMEELEERFKLIQEAYNLIMDAREKGYDPSPPQNHSSASQPQGMYASSGSRFDDFNPFSWFNEYDDGGLGSGRGFFKRPLEYQAAERYINTGCFFEATNALSSVPIDNRDAKWLYLYALANAGLGNITQARELAGKASRMEPDKAEYRHLHVQLSGTTNQYRERGRTFSEKTASCANTAYGGYTTYAGGKRGSDASLCGIKGLLSLGCIGFGFLLNYLFCHF